MQQTQTYKLNLVEPSDPFTPDALNRNTQKIEDAMVIHEGVVDKRMDGLETRIVALEGKKVAVGGYTGTYNYDSATAAAISQDLVCGFRPRAGFVYPVQMSRLFFFYEGAPVPNVTPTENGIRVTQNMNAKTYIYYFILFS